MDFIEVSAKNVDDAVIEACQKLVVTRDKLEYEVIEEGSNGFLGIGSKPAVIKARVKATVDGKAVDFLKEVFAAMNMAVVIDAKEIHGLGNQIEISRRKLWPRCTEHFF